MSSGVHYGASLVAQTVKNLPVIQETWVQSLGWEDPLEKGMAIHCNILIWEIPWTEETGTVHRAAECIIKNAFSIFHNDYAFSSMNRSTRGSFSDLYCDNLVGFLDVKPTWRVKPPLELWPLEVSHPPASPHSASSNFSQLAFKHFYRFMAPVAWAARKWSQQYSLCSPDSPDLGVAVCSVNSVFWWIQAK